MRADILRGDWSPGERLSPTALAVKYGASTTVAREALTRLAGEHFVELQPHRGFFVPRLHLPGLQDLTLVRCQVESLALELSIDRGDLTWESELIACHHRLIRTPRRLADSPGQIGEEWAVLHREFHAKLIEACNVPLLLSLCADMSDATELYRRWAAPTKEGSRRDVEAEHRRILEAALARDAHGATEGLREHYQRTVNVLVASGLVSGVGSDPSAPD